METWGSLLTDIRADLQDTGEKPRWANDTLFVYAKDALRDYSLWFPRRVDQMVLTLDSGKYTLPSDFIEDIQVESPTGTFLERRLDRPGVKHRRTNLYYFLQGGSLYLSGTPLGNNLYLTYLAAHPVPASAANAAFELTVPDSDLELIRLYTKAKIYGLMRSKTATLDRYKPVGDRQDNPLAPETEDLWGEYYAKIAQRIPGGVIALYRSGRLR